MEKQTTSRGKIQEICDLLKNETIEPAKQEAAEIVENAHIEAAEIIKIAKEEVKSHQETVKKKLEEEKRTFNASMNLAVKQTLETLRQSIQKELFSPAIEDLLKKPLTDPETMAKLISAIIQAVEKEGTDAEISAVVAKEVSAKKVAEHLASSVLDHLRGKVVEVGEFKGGVQVKLHDSKLTVDMSDEALKELLASFVCQEFRSMIFNV